jgi:Spy/CpxP family protein refolding chaperone
MKTYKLSLVAALVLGGLLACSSMAFAQDAKEGKKKRGGPSVEQQMATLKEKLDLKPEQETKIKDVLEDTSKKRQELRADQNLSQEDRRDKMMALMTAQDKKFKEILTADQFTKWEKVRDEMRANRGGGGGGGEKKADK